MKEQSLPFDLIAFDADDTLWHNETLYTMTQDRFKELLAPYHEGEIVDQELYETEMRNLAYYGYGIKSFTLSMIETAIELTGGRVGVAETPEITGFIACNDDPETPADRLAEDRVQEISGAHGPGGPQNLRGPDFPTTQATRKKRLVEQRKLRCIGDATTARPVTVVNKTIRQLLRADFRGGRTSRCEQQCGKPHNEGLRGES